MASSFWPRRREFMKVGTQAMVWQANTNYNLIHPRDVPYPKWQVRIQVALLFLSER